MKKQLEADISQDVELAGRPSDVSFFFMKIFSYSLYIPTLVPLLLDPTVPPAFLASLVPWVGSPARYIITLQH